MRLIRIQVADDDDDEYVNKVKVFFDHCHPSLMIQRNRED